MAGLGGVPQLSNSTRRLAVAWLLRSGGALHSYPCRSFRACIADVGRWFNVSQPLPAAPPVGAALAEAADGGTDGGWNAVRWCRVGIRAFRPFPLIHPSCRLSLPLFHTPSLSLSIYPCRSARCVAFPGHGVEDLHQHLRHPALHDRPARRGRQRLRPRVPRRLRRPAGGLPPSSLRLASHSHTPGSRVVNTQRARPAARHAVDASGGACDTSRRISVPTVMPPYCVAPRPDRWLAGVAALATRGVHLALRRDQVLA